MTDFTMLDRELRGFRKRLRQMVSGVVVPLLGASLLLTAVGCGPKAEGRLKAYPVEGKVTVGGNPEEGIRVTLVPKDRSNPKIRQAQAFTQNDGAFKLTTYVANDGAIEGDYVVTLQYLKLVDKDGVKVVGPNVLPDKYAKPDSTDISFQVKPGANTIPVIDVK